MYERAPLRLLPTERGDVGANRVEAIMARHARVFVSVLGSVKKREQTLEGLAAAHGVLQARLARELRMKRTPTLAFEYDPSVEEGVRMSKLIDSLVHDE